MARQRLNVVSQPASIEYHVYHGGIEHLAGIPIVEANGRRTVRMTAEQARYFIDQGVIGRQSEDESSDDAKALRRQFRRSRSNR